MQNTSDDPGQVPGGEPEEAERNAGPNSGSTPAESPSGETSIPPDAQDAGPINMGPNSLCVTHGIEVEAAAQYLESRSFPEQKRWLYAYRVRIKNVGPEPQKLLSRHWIITDSNGERREVRGVGVVGEQPRLEPGDVHEYRSMCDLSTAWGTMEGTYQFVTDEGAEHEVQVGRFFLVETAENAIVVE